MKITCCEVSNYIIFCIRLFCIAPHSVATGRKEKVVIYIFFLSSEPPLFHRILFSGIRKKGKRCDILVRSFQNFCYLTTCYQASFRVPSVDGAYVSERDLRLRLAVPPGIHLTTGILQTPAARRAAGTVLQGVDV